jgi:hypothetical protein
MKIPTKYFLILFKEKRRELSEQSNISLFDQLALIISFLRRPFSSPK